MAARRDLIKRHFSDVPELVNEDTEQAGFGALGGVGSVNHYSASAQMSPEGDGVAYRVVCDNCGATNIITLNWQELIIVAHAHLPRGWKFQDGRVHPETGCKACHYLTTVQITPDEAARHVKAGISGGKVPMQTYNAIAGQLRR